MVLETPAAATGNARSICLVLRIPREEAGRCASQGYSARDAVRGINDADTVRCITSGHLRDDPLLCQCLGRTYAHRGRPTLGSGPLANQRNTVETRRKAWIALIGVGAVLIVGAALTNDHPIKETIDKIGDGRGMREAMVQPIALNRLASMRSFGSVP